MAVPRSSRWLVTLLALLFLVAPAAALSPEEAVRTARRAIDHAEYPAAEKVIDDALRQAGSRQDEVIFSLRVMRAEVFIARGDPDEGKKWLADELPAELRRSAPAVRRLLMLAFIATDPAEKQRRIKHAREMALRYQPQVLPELYARMGVSNPDLTHAIADALEGIRLAKKYGDAVNEVKAMMALQFRYIFAGQIEESVYWGEKALPLARANQLTKNIGQIEGNLGWGYIEAGDYEYAAELLEHAYRIALDIRAEAERVAWLIQLGNLRFQKREWAAADRYYREAVRYGQKHPQLPFALANLASIAIEKGQFADARKFNDAALDLKRKTDQREAQMRSMTLDARIAAAEGRIDVAVTELNSVISRAKEPSTIWEARGRLGEVLAKGNRIEPAFEQFRRALATVRDTKNKIASELRFSFYNTATEIFSTYVDLLIDHHRFNEALAVTELIRADAREISFGRPDGSPRAIAAQQGATILSYWLGPRRSYVWRITANEVRVAALEPEETIRVAVDAYRRQIAELHGTLELTRARGEQLHKLLGIPKDLPRDSRVIVIPDGSLHALNFETLVVPAPKPHYWIEDVNIVAASSIQLLARRVEPPSRKPRMLLIGNPLQANSAFPPLSHAAEEMAIIARHFPADRMKVLREAAATPAAYQSAVPQSFDFVHFVAHGVATRRRPLDSAVILSTDANRNYKLVAREILKKPLRARLVTISSCHGAGTRSYTGEGLVGLAWAFLRAGASNVIAALWEVDDSATPQLMDDVYRAIESGRDPATALRDAKLKQVRSKGAYRRPRYWAPFVLYAGR